MALISLHQVDLAFGDVPILASADFSIERGEHVCLLGRNGTGKSTLLAVIAGRQRPDGGSLRHDPALRIAELPQQVPAELSGPLQQVVREGAGALAHDLDRYGALSSQGAAPAELGALQARIETAGGWDLDARVQRLLTQFGLDKDAEFGELSGGMQRRALLARALAGQPDLLLLDEPTNHLDIAGIEWLESFVLNHPGAILYTTHDRAFLQRTATRILELERGQLTSWPGDYDNYLRRRDERLHAELQAESEFDRRLAEEEVWIRQGIKARRTRNEGRVRRLQAMRAERAQRLARQGQAKVQVEQAERSGRLVIEAESVAFAYPDRPIVQDFSVLIERGDRVALLGPNGAGKTTVLRLLTGELTPQQGRIRLGASLAPAYFDQHRAALDEQSSVADAVADGRDFVDQGGKRRHVLSYLQDYLFSPQRARSPVAALSGGERARLLLARLFAQPSNLLIMDEPTNDLDMDTLDLLEEQLLDYQGTLLLVSHDRSFIDRVATSTLVLDGSGRVQSYVGGYTDYLRQRPAQPGSETAGKAETRDKVIESETSVQPSAPPRSRKLSYKLQRELDAMPHLVEALEQDIDALQAKLADPALYQAADAGAEVASLRTRLDKLEVELDAAMERWVLLESGEKVD
jgi:ABC transport system ATP-binding/permease protein